MNYTLKVYKGIAGQPANQEWSNQYTLEIEDTIDSALALTAVTEIVDFEKSIHAGDVEFRRAVLSTVEQEGVPSPSDAFKTFAIGGNGANPYFAEEGASVDHLPLEMVLVVQHEASTGRAGRCEYRRCVAAQLWKDVAGNPQLAGAQAAEFVGIIETAYTAVGFPKMVLLPKGAGNEDEGRMILSWKVLGIRSRNRRSRRKPQLSTSGDGFMTNLAKVGIDVALMLASARFLKGKKLTGPQLATAIATIGALGADLVQAAQELVLPDPVG